MTSEKKPPSNIMSTRRPHYGSPPRPPPLRRGTSMFLSPTKRNRNAEVKWSEPFCHTSNNNPNKVL